MCDIQHTKHTDVRELRLQVITVFTIVPGTVAKVFVILIDKNNNLITSQSYFRSVKQLK